VDTREYEKNRRILA